MQDQLGLQVTVQYEDGRQELDQDLKVVLFQSIRELLFNAAKHSKVKQAEVAFYYRDEQIIEICVRDQGIGFDTEKLNSRAKMIGGQGLRGIMDRLSAMGGEVKISSAPGAGTQTTIRVPAKLHR
jgi:two-component system CheB/CheR fusion protein